MSLTRFLIAVANIVAQVSCSRAPLPAPVRPLSPTPDAPFRATPPALTDAPGAVLLNAPPVETTVLSNGLSIWVVHRPQLPYVALSVSSREAGARSGHESSALLGLALRSVIEGGTVWMDQRAIEPPHIDGEGVGYQVEALQSRFQLRVTTAHLSDGIRVLGRTIQSPALDDRDLAEVRAAELERLQDASNELNGALLEILLKAALGDAAARFLPTHTDEVERATSEALRRCYQAIFTPRSSVLIAVGDLTASQLQPLAEREFGSWNASVPSPRSALESTTSPPHPAAATYLSLSRRIHLVLQADLGQARVMLLQPGPGTRAAQDELAFELLAEVAFGSRSRSALGLRHDQGVTYGIDRAIIPGHDLGLLSIHAAFETSETARSITTLLQLLRDLQQRPVSSTELGLAKVALSARLERTLHDNAALSNYLADSFAAGKSPDSLRTLGSSIAAITAADLQRVASRYLRPDQVEIGVAGPPSLGEELSRIGELVAYHIDRNRPGAPPED